MTNEAPTNPEQKTPSITSDSRILTKWFKLIALFYKNNFLNLVCIKLIAIGLIFRIWILNSPLGNIDEKQALVLLQAKDFASGHISMMREGRFTGGSLEVLLNVPFVAIFGTTKTATWIVPFLLLIATSFVLWRAFVNTPYKKVMRLVMACLWISPAYFVVSSSRASGHVSLEIFLYTCIFASAYYAAHSLRNLRYFYLWAFLSGLAVWTNPFSIALVILCLVWIFWSAPAMKKHKTRGLAYFVLGSSFLWVHVLEVITSNSKLSLFTEGTDSKSEFPKNALTTLSQIIGQGTYSTNGSSDSNVSFIGAFLSVCLLGVFIYSVYKLKGVNRTDFKKLQTYSLVVFLIVPIIYFFAGQQLLPEALIVMFIPILFIVVSANKSHFYISAALTLFFAMSVLSINLSIDESRTSLDAAASKLSRVLEAQSIDRALSSHELGYVMTARSDDKIFVTPFDGNDFNKSRSDVVHRSVEAIVVDTNDKEQTDLAFCVQGTFKTTFKAIRSDSFDVLIVNKDLRGKVWDVFEKCNAR